MLSEQPRFLMSLEKNVMSVELMNQDFLDHAFPGDNTPNYVDVKKRLTEDSGALSEVMPWFLADLCGVPREECLDIAAAWEGILLYVKELDTVSDTRELSQKNRDALLITSTLLAEGIRRITLLLGRESDQAMSYLYEAAFYQRKDNRISAGTDFIEPGDIQAHLAVMAGKNRFVSILEAFFQKKGDIRPETLRTFLESMCCLAQLIDDMKDIELDFQMGSYSHLTEPLKEGYYLGQEDVFAHLLRTGHIERSVRLALDFLHNSIEMSLDAELFPSAKEEAVEFLKETERDLQSLLKTVAIYQTPNDHYPAITEKNIRSKISKLWLGT